MDKRLEDEIIEVKDKLDSVLELLAKLAEHITEGEQLAVDDIEAWKQRCRERASARRARRRR
ncbi:MAG: hypothetical protein GY896_22960 [Gammaproteobacteria bacterium]|nr:hypothetical protein [Gammaproteobacteria bacterium]